MGMGTTAVVAIREGRRYIGLDYVAEYVEKAAARIALADCDADADSTVAPQSDVDNVYNELPCLRGVLT